MKNLIIILISFLTLSVFAQKKRACGFNAIYDKVLADSNYLTKEAEKQLFIKNFKNNKADTVITIPVVVHVIYRLNTENISNAQINSQLAVLNRDFRRLNSDTSNVKSGFSKADVKFEFALATIDPNGNTTTGITRTPTTVDNIGFSPSDTTDYYELVPAWNSNLYLNIWVCDVGDIILGFAYPPNTPGISKEEDGVVIGSEYFGTTGTVSAPFNQGRTTTHEVGHFFDLLHIWGDGSGSCSTDDLISDTPNQSTEIYDCPASSFTCGSSDMLSNFLQYTDDSCMGNFTQGQKSRMRMALYMNRDSLQYGKLLGITSLSENKLPKVAVFPNPNQGKFRIDLPVNTNLKNVEFFIYDLSGKKIPFSYNWFNNSCEVNLRAAKPGFYFLQLKIDDKTYTKKLINY